MIMLSSTKGEKIQITDSDSLIFISTHSTMLEEFIDSFETSAIQA